MNIPCTLSACIRSNASIEAHSVEVSKETLESQAMSLCMLCPSTISLQVFIIPLEPQLIESRVILGIAASTDSPEIQESSYLTINGVYLRCLVWSPFHM